MRRLTAATVLSLLATLGLAGCSSDPGPAGAVQAFLDGWTSGNLDGATLIAPTGARLDGADVTARIQEFAGDLSPARATFEAREPQVSGDEARSQVTVRWTIADGLVWEYQTTVASRRVADEWRVLFTPSTVHPWLEEKRHFEARLRPAERGPVLDGAGEPIVTARPVVTVGIEPRRITDQAALIAALDAAFRRVAVAVDLTDLPGRIAAARPDAFIEVVTLRREVYDQIRSLIRDLPGTVFQESTRHLAPTRSFARALLGTVGDVQREQLDAHPGKYLIGEQIGLSGLQEEFDDQLRGQPGVRVVIPQPRRDDGTGEDPRVAFEAEPRTGEPLRTTLDQRIQTAAEAALAAQSRRSALVAVRISDGAIVAVANGPDGGDENLAFHASVPPGSTFKMITTLGLLDGGAVSPDTTVDCPRTVTVDGRTFTNAGGFELGAVPFHVDFARSCNTAFAALAPRLGGDGLRRAAATVGIGATWDPGTAAFTGSVPANVSTVESAAAAFGQGQTLVSPLALAAATAAVARGTWFAPTLFTRTAGPPSPTALNAGSVEALRAMMREVVTAGTATSLAGVPGAPVFAKTGTAEFNDNPADTHAWTIGWQGDLAFAVFVERGGGSGDTAVPTIEAFLRSLA